MDIKNLISELKRRNVFRVATVYAIAGWLIIQISDTVFPRLGLPEWTITFVIALVGIGFPISLIIAWAFELTAQGLKKSEDVRKEESITSSTGKKINRLIIAVLLVAVIFLLVERVFFARTTIMAENSMKIENASIAVLPFQDFSPEGNQEYFSDGLSEELLNVLAKVKALKVAGRTSSFKFKGMNENLTEIGRELKVDHILEGSVRKSGNRIRVTAQLIKVEDGYHMWSENFDRELTVDNIFSIQEEISRKVVAELKGRLLSNKEEWISESPTQDIEAYNSYLEATQLEVSRRPEDIWAAIEKYKTATRIDPGFALAYARMAISYGNLNWDGNLSLDEMKKLMRENIDQALLIDGNLGKAYEALGYYYLNTYDGKKALETFERAVELLPGDAAVLDGYHLALEVNDRFMDGVEQMRKAYELDPLNPNIATHHGNHLRFLGEYEEALRIFDTIIKEYPTYSRAKTYKSYVLAGAGYGELDEAFKYVHANLKDGQEDVPTLVRLANLAEDVDAASLRAYYINRIGELFPENQRYFYSKMNLLFAQGEIEQVYSMMDQGIEMFADEFRKDAMNFKAYLEMSGGNYSESIRLLEETNPYLTAVDTDLNEETKNEYVNYITALIISETEDTERLNILIDDFCEYAQEQIDSAESESQKLYYKWNIVTCHNFRDNFEKAVEIYRDQYFNQKFKIGYPQAFKRSVLNQRMEGYEPYGKLKNDIYSDLSLMRDNIFTYLKAEGEWQDEWGVEN